MERIFYTCTYPLIPLTLAATMVLQTCDFADPREADPNPNLTEEKLLDVETIMAPWIAGLERQTAIIYNNIVPETAIVSDNYRNQGLFFNTNFDRPDIDSNYEDIELALFTISKLRVSARYGLNKVASADNSTTDEQLAECHFFLGLAYLLQGEIFVQAPVEPSGIPQSPATNLDSAIRHFSHAIQLSGQIDQVTGYLLALARAHYAKGNKQAATKAAALALQNDNHFIRFAQYDGQNGPENLMQKGLYDRANTHDLQPLPRLDFLDPKYHGITSGFEVNIPLLKAEEAMLILAEAALAEEDGLEKAKNIMEDLIALVNDRPAREITAIDPRLGANGFRPNADTVEVRASTSDPFRNNLVLDRVRATLDDVDKKIMVPYISGTSLAPADIQSINTLDEALEKCYLLRQEVLIGEGRRMSDLGIRFPLPQTELLQNENVDQNHPALTPVIPNFIPQEGEMDAFDYDEEAGRVTILHNMNRQIVAHKNSAMVAPFH